MSGPAPNFIIQDEVHVWDDAKKKVAEGLLSTNEARAMLLPPGPKAEPTVDKRVEDAFIYGDDAKVSVDGKELQHVVGVDFAFSDKGLRETLVLCSRKVGKVAAQTKLADELGIKVISRDETPDDAVYVVDQSKLWQPEKLDRSDEVRSSGGDWGTFKNSLAAMHSAQSAMIMTTAQAHRAMARMAASFSGFADTWLDPKTRYRPSIERARAAEWLAHYLRDGMMRATTVLRAAKRLAIPDGALHGAKREMGIVESNGYWLLPAGLREEL